MTSGNDRATETSGNVFIRKICWKRYLDTEEKTESNCQMNHTFFTPLKWCIVCMISMVCVTFMYLLSHKYLFRVSTLCHLFYFIFPAALSFHLNFGLLLIYPRICNFSFSLFKILLPSSLRVSMLSELTNEKCITDEPPITHINS